jgi:hypothetical protein
MWSVGQVFWKERLKAQGKDGRGQVFGAQAASCRPYGLTVSFSRTHRKNAP